MAIPGVQSRHRMQEDDFTIAEVCWKVKSETRGLSPVEARPSWGQTAALIAMHQFTS